MCGPYWSKHYLRQRRLADRLYGSNHDRPRFQLVRDCGTALSQTTTDNERQRQGAAIIGRHL
jgi:hypothetical protein